MTVLAESATLKLLRRAFLLLAVISAAATAIELALERHWQAGTQIIPWVSLVLIFVAVALVAFGGSFSLVRAAQVLAVVVVLTALYGIWAHVDTNHDVGELDQRYSQSWENLQESTRWWLAVTKTVGPTPPLA